MTKRGKPRRRRIVLRVTGLVVVGLLVAEGVGLLLVWRQHETYPAYWGELAKARVPDDAVRILAYGDSTVMGIGAWRPEDSLVGRIVRHVAARTGRPVHVVNRSAGGGGLASVNHRVTQADPARADLVVVSAGWGDVGRASVGEFERQLRALTRRLPAKRTVLSGLPPRGDWEPYQKVLAEVAEGSGIEVADVAGEFRRARRLDIFAPDFTHVNSTGYRLWFQAFRPHVNGVIGRLH